MSQKTALGIACLVGAIALSGCRHAAPLVPITQRVSEPVTSGSFIVGPRTFKPFKVVVTPGMSNARLQGTFSASGARNDIECTLLDETQFRNWQNRGVFEAAYESGRVTNATIDVALPQTPGTYYMVFSNRFSIFSNKAVEADVRLTYDRVDSPASRGRGRRGYRE